MRTIAPHFLSDPTLLSAYPSYHRVAGLDFSAPRGETFYEALQGKLHAPDDSIANVGGVELPRSSLKGKLPKDYHSQYVAHPGAQTYWTDFVNPAVSTAAFQAHPLRSSQYIGHAYQELHLRGFRLNGQNDLVQTKNSDDVVTLIYKLAQMNKKLIGIVPISILKLTIGFYDPASGRTKQVAASRFTPKNPDLLYSSQDLFFQKADVKGEIQFASQGMNVKLTTSDLTIDGEFLQLGQGHGDLVIDHSNRPIRHRSIQWWNTKTLSITSRGEVFQIHPDQVVSLGDYAQGLTPRDHSWDWATFSGQTEEGEKVNAIFEGVRSKLTSEQEQKGWLTITSRSRLNTIHERRLAGMVSYEYDPSDMSKPWLVHFHDQRGNQVTLQANPVGISQDNGIHIPFFFRLFHKQLWANAKLLITTANQKRTLVAGQSSLEAAKMKH